MRRLIKNIEQVLYREECVVVPEVGAFLRHDTAASIDLAKGLIYPGHTTLSFNAGLQQNDGVLVQQYMSAFSMGYKKALALLESDIREFREDLQRNGLIQVGTLGRLTMERSEGRISFLPNPDHPYSIEFYGLMPVSKLPDVKTAEVAPVVAKESMKKAGKDVVYLPVNLRYLRYGAAAAVLALAVMLIPANKLSFPEGASQYQAGFLLPQQIELKQKPAPTAKEEVAPAATAQMLGLPLIQAQKGDNKFYIVIASLRSADQTEKYLQSNKPQKDFPGAGVLVTSTGMHRVFAGVFNSQEEAQAELNNNVTNIDKYSGAWIYQY